MCKLNHFNCTQIVLYFLKIERDQHGNLNGCNLFIISNYKLSVNYK